MLELFEKEKVELNTSQLSDVVEMFEKKDLLDEQEDQAEEKESSTTSGQTLETSKKADGIEKT